MFTFIKRIRSGIGQEQQSGPETAALVSAATCIGSRQGNQDTFRAGWLVPCSPPRRTFSRTATLRWHGAELFCVCDGVGGACKGDVAAKGALQAIEQYLRRADRSCLPLSQLVTEAAEAAQQWVLQYYRRVNLMGGCTLTMIGIRGKEYAFANIGDSPAFLFHPDGSIQELSCRHNMAWENLRHERPVHPGDECHLLRYLGMPDTSAADIAHISTGSLEPGSRILLCSDGITNVFPPESLEEALRSGATALPIAQDAALPSDSDNCTLVCVEILSTE